MLKKACNEYGKRIEFGTKSSCELGVALASSDCKAKGMIAMAQDAQNPVIEKKMD